MPLHACHQSFAVVQRQAERIERRMGVGAATASDIVDLLRSIGATQFDRHTPFHSRPLVFRAATVAPPCLGRSPRFVGYDFHPGSVEQACVHAADHGVTSNTRFEVAAAKEYPGTDFDLVTCFDCLHDMGDPIGASAHVRQSLKADGTWMIVEPMAGDRLEHNLNPVGRLYYAGSTMICVPTSLSQEVGAALGAQAGEAKLREAITAGGFRDIRRATETPFNMILEARP
jgi:Methyltransferase domain